MRARLLVCVTALSLCLTACSDDPQEQTAPAPVAPSLTTPPTPVTPTASPDAPAAATPPRPVPTVTGVVAEGLETPWGMAFLPDGSALVGLRDDGRILRVPAAGGEPEQVGEVAGAGRGSTSEGGLLGLALHPDFEEQPWLYAFYTAGSENRLARMRFEDGRIGPTRVLLDGIDAAAFHNGGRIGFGPDGMLYVATGDGTERETAQDPDSLNGKVLRLTPDGKPAPGNPRPGSPVFSLGHRNIEGLAWDSDGQLWASEFGEQTWDELNRIEASANYGWPEEEGRGDGEGFTNPFVQWRTEDASPAGVAIVDDIAYVAALRGERLWQVPLGGGDPKPFLREEYGRLRSVDVAPDGALWVTTSNTDGRGDPTGSDDRILRVELR